MPAYVFSQRAKGHVKLSLTTLYRPLAFRSIDLSPIRGFAQARLYLFAPVLQHRFHFHGELISQRPVDQTVVEGQREIASGADRDGFVHHHRLLHDAPYAENRHLRLINYGRGEEAAEAAEIGDGESSALDLVWLQMAGAGARGQVCDVTLQTDDILLVGIADHRYDQAVVQRYCDADVDVAVINDIGSVDGRVDDG